MERELDAAVALECEFHKVIAVLRLTCCLTRQMSGGIQFFIYEKVSRPLTSASSVSLMSLSLISIGDASVVLSSRSRSWDKGCLPTDAMRVCGIAGGIWRGT